MSADITLELDSSTASSATLCAQIAAGSRQAETLLHRRYWRGLMLMLERRSPNSQVAEDLAQDTLLIVLQKLRTGDIAEPSMLGGFIHQTAKNCFSNWQKKEWRRATIADTEQVESVVSPILDPVRQLVSSHSLKMVRRLLKDLKKERDREVLHRFYVLEQDKLAVCEALEMKPTDFDRIISRARGRMRRLIAHRLGANTMEDWNS